MRLKTLLQYLFSLMLLLPTQFAYAEEWQELDSSKPFKIGYARIKFPDGKWLVHSGEFDRTKLTSGSQDVSRTAREFILLDRKTGVHLASAYIKASDAGGNFYTTWECTKDEKSYVIEESAHERFHHCAYASGLVNVESFFEKNGTFEFQNSYFFKQGISQQTQGHHIAVRASNDNGMQFTITLFLRAGFTPDLAKTPKAKVPIQVGNKIAAWTDTLYQQATSSVYSLFGGIVIPDLTFDLSGSDSSRKLASVTVRN